MSLSTIALLDRVANTVLLECHQPDLVSSFLNTHRGAFAPMSQLLPPRSAKDSDDEDSDDDVGGTAHDDGLSPVNPDQRKKVR
jgi:hypothetical protein